MKHYSYDCSKPLGKQRVVRDMTPEELEKREARIIIDNQNQIDYEANKYKDDRRNAYASEGDQLDMIYWDKKNGTNTFTDHIDAVKAQYPKPAEE